MIFGPWRRAVLAEARAVNAESRSTTLEGQLVEAHDTIRALSQTIREQVEQIVGMKRDGFQPPAQQYTEASEPDLPAAVLEAMYEQAKPGDALWSQIARQVQSWGNAISPEEIAKRVRQGEDFDWEDVG